MAQKDRGEPRKLTITEVVKTITGEGKNGPWALREIKALNAAGQPITEQLKTFADVTPLLGKLDEFYIERQEHEKYGVSFLVTPKTSGTALKLEALTQRVAALEQTVARLQGGSNPPTAVPQSAPAGHSSPATSDEDIPF